jgi:hypothetical protein
MKRFHADDNASITIFALFMFMTMAVVAGLAVDISNLMARRTYLQVAADAAGHAAIYTRETGSEDEAILKALEIAEGAMPREVFGQVLTENDIQFGTYDRETRTFTELPGSRKAVFVATGQIAARDNSVASYLLKLIGFGEIDVRTGAVYETFRPTCLREGFVADGVVDVQSNNTYFRGFCIHSNTYISINNNNFFEAGTVVSMPDLALLDIAASGYDQNEGLAAALREGQYNLRILNRLTDIIAGLQNMDPDYLPDYITSMIPVIFAPNKNIMQSDLVQGRVHIMTCINDGKQITLSNSLALHEMVIVTNCKMKFDNSVSIQDAIIATTHNSARSFNSSQGFTIGRDDNCAEGGGAQLLTMGGVSFPSGMEAYGGQIIAMGDIEFTANAYGIEGISLVAGGVISGTSNMEMGFCYGAGMEDNFEADYFRLAG